ncbi:hypothetical protein ACIRQY_34925 [Streptomyces sp. NPDC101490]|uniref:hypothetical protein n=1 Tax=Streptomyces sp. NPDC101490 TaxID=3366143 RepID=UPI0037F9EFAC
MSMRIRKFTFRASLVAAVTVVAAAIALISSIRSNTPALESEDVEGVWRAEGIQRSHVSIRADGTAELNNAPGGCRLGGGGGYSGPAKWVFDTVPDESPGVRFNYQPSGTSEVCSIYFSIPKADRAYFIEDQDLVNYVRDGGGSK